MAYNDTVTDALTV
jgi:hypothetical protein